MSREFGETRRENFSESAERKDVQLPESDILWKGCCGKVIDPLDSRISEDIGVTISNPEGSIDSMKNIRKAYRGMQAAIIRLPSVWAGLWWSETHKGKTGSVVCRICVSFFLFQMFGVWPHSQILHKQVQQI